MNRINQIQELVSEGVLGPELCPTPYYWHWSVNRPDLLPIDFVENYQKYEEIRWYGEE